MKFPSCLVPLMAGLVILLGVVSSDEGRLNAQEPDEVAAEEQSAFDDLYDALDQGTDHEAILESTMSAVREQYAAIPELANAEAASPGLIDDVMAAIRPVFRDYLLRQRALYRPHLVAVLKQNLTPSEARTIADFHRSELGKRLLRTLSRNYSPDALFADFADSDLAVDELAEKYAEDISNAGAATARSLKREDVIALRDVIRGKPEFQKLGLLNRQLAAASAAAKEPPNAEELARLQAAQESAFARYLGN